MVMVKLIGKLPYLSLQSEQILLGEIDLCGGKWCGQG